MKTVLESYTQALINWPVSGDGVKTKHIDQTTAEDKIGHEEFLDTQLMSMNQSVVSEKDQECIKNLQQNQKQLPDNWVNQAETAGDAGD